MSYQGWATGELRVTCKEAEQRDAVRDFILKQQEEGGLLYPFPPESVRKGDGFDLRVEFDTEIRYYFSDNLESLTRMLVDAFPNVSVKGAFRACAGNDIPYRLEVNSGRRGLGMIQASDEVDWLLNYSCEDIQKIAEYANKHCKRSPVYE